ncbi:hypothetical protein SCA05_24850 [Staphylococcus carnosus]|uniref:hypothetical protein n=2 Tax=Staphylococcus carnosus TaxID=1281 RepID=UPI000CD0B778|nr:hypothetical protein [Staphylococcus carnosus]PNZ98250.1 hypothetical protein CD153_11085 [Staphylococcus carnosus]UTB82538.1 hypothetical protein A2I67_04155 [Staphylococcus carnosus]GEP80692.1 hypothetical protein SCA05_24850 [Staphylococcus carnosus]SUM06993.1 Uncharacterised protein [Staphylococcus carnosus]
MMFWIVATILLGTIAIVSLIYNAIKDSKIDALEYEVAYGKRTDNQIIIDNQHKLIIFQYKKGLMKPEAILKMSKALDDFGNKEYKLLVVDNTFNVSIK